MTKTQAEYKKGLEDVIAGETKICDVDGEKGDLIYRGYSIFDLAEHSTFEEVAFLLLIGHLPTAKELAEFNQKLLKYRKFEEHSLAIVKALSKTTHPMKVLQTAVAALGNVWDSGKGKDTTEILIAYMAQISLLTAAYSRVAHGQDIIQPKADLSHAANFLYMLSGKVPPVQHARRFDQSLILHMEHGFNASTFTARVVASSLAPVSAVMSSAIGSLSGPLHGGANEQVLEMLKGIPNVEAVEKFVDDRLARKDKIMGMGHRVYKVKDPRAIILQKWLKEIGDDSEARKRVAILEKVESYFTGLNEKTGKRIYPNVDFYSGVLFTNLGIDVILFTPLFAIARVAGWAAHTAEQWEDNRIFRPESLYVGDVSKKYVAIEKR